MSAFKSRSTPLPDKKFPPQESEFTLSGRWDVSDVEGPAFKDFLKKLWFVG